MPLCICSYSHYTLPRSLPNVILGGYGTPAPSAGGAAKAAVPAGSHKEIDVAGEACA